jgi:hypothetical protein
VRWRTLTWENKPQYDFAVAWGVAGIPLFLADYARLTGTARALELAEGALRWCSRPERLAEGSAEAWCRDGLMRGRAGVGAGWLRLAAVSRDAGHLAQAAAAGDALLPKAPGPYTDWCDGAAGEGVFLLRLAQATREPRFLDGASRRAAWLASVAVRDGRGLAWPWEVGGEPAEAWYGLGFHPGAAGVGHVLLRLYQETGEAAWAAVAREAAETLRRQATPDHGGLNWPETLDGLARGEPLKCQQCNGAPGVGLFFLTAHEALGSAATGDRDGAASAAGVPGAGAYLALAEAAGEATFGYGDVRRNASYCHGLAGNGELFLDLYLATQRARWRERAHDFARRAFAYRTATPEGDVWQADDPGFSGPEYMFGASGTGHFFLRLWRPDLITRPLV